MLKALPGATADMADVSGLELADFDDDVVYDSPAVRDLTQRLADADALVIASPVYNWATSATLKGVIECTGADDTGRKVRAWEDKVVTFLCAGGVPHGYLAPLPVANSLMLDFRCIINPYLVYCVGEDFQGESVMPEASARLERALSVASELASLLAHRTYASTWTL